MASNFILNDNSLLPEGKEAAKALERLGALCLDYLCIVVLFFLTVIFMFLIIFLLDYSSMQDLGSAHGGYVAMIVFTGYSAFTVFYFSQIFRPSAQTIGDKILKIRVIPLNGKRIGLYVAFLRIFFLCVPLLGLISIYYAYVNEKQSYLDVLCRTVTLKES